MGRKKDAERRKRREQRMAERMQQTQPHQNLDKVVERQDVEKDKGSIVHDASPLTTSTTKVASSQRILETIVNMDDNSDQTVNINETAGEAKIPDIDREGTKLFFLLPIILIIFLYQSF